MPRTRLHTIFFHVGFTVLVCQAMFAREFLILFHGSEIALGVFFAAWLAWLGAGAWMGVRLATRISAAGAGARAMWAAFVLLPMVALIQLILLRHARDWVSTPPAEIVPLGILSLVMFAVTAPVGLLAGAMFPLGCALAGRARGAVGWLYGLEALGSCAGGVVFTFWWIDTLAPIPILLVLVALHGLHAAALAHRRVLTRLAQTIALAAAVALGAGWATRWDQASRRARFATLQPALDLLEEADTRYQLAAVARRGGQFVVLSNGKIAAAFPDHRANEQRAAFVMAQRPDARRALLIGGELEGPAQALLRFESIERVTILIQDAAAADLLQRHLTDDLAMALRDKRRVEIVHADARDFLRRSAKPRAGQPLGHERTTPPELFDVVWVLAPDPSTASLNRFYTREFFEWARDCMSPRGVIVCSITSAAHYLGEDVVSYSASVFATLRAVFASVIVTPGDVHVFAASADGEQVTDDWQALARRYAAIRPPDALFPPEGFADALPPTRVAFVRERLEGADAPLNTDARPMAFYYNMILWGRFAGSSVSNALRAIERNGMWLLIAPLIVALALRALQGASRRGPAEQNKPAFAIVVAIVAVGWFAMAADMILLFAYQNAFGFLYQRIGLLVALFMLGMAGGSLVGAARSLRLSAGARRSFALSLAALAGFAAALPSLVGRVESEWAFLALFVMAGTLSGLAFALGAEAREARAKRRSPDSLEAAQTGGWLDAADHFGGALGAALTGAIMVPLWGIAQTAYGLAALAGAALAFNAMDALPSALRSWQPRSTWGWALAWMALSVWLVALGSRERAARPPATFPQELLAAFSGRTEFDLKRKPFTHYRPTDSTEPEVIFSSSETAPDARGWAGPIRILIDMDTRAIRHVRILEQHETPSYAGDLDKWIRQFEGLPYASGFRVMQRPGPLPSLPGARGIRSASSDPSAPQGLSPSLESRTARSGVPIDGIAGATVTSRAIVDLMNRAAFAAGTRLLDLPLDDAAFEVLTWRDALLKPSCLALIAAFILFVPAYRHGGRRVRLALLTFNFIALGLWTNQVFTLPHLARISTGALFSPTAASALLLCVLVALSGVLFGAAFCGYICPFGILQEWISVLGRARAIAQGARGGLHRLRYALLALCLIGFWVSGGGAAFVSFSPMDFVFSYRMAPLVWILLAVTLVGCLRYFRFFCRLFCPAGAFVSLLNHLGALDAPTRRRRNPARCEVGMTTTTEIDCIRCNRCMTPLNRPVDRSVGRDFTPLVAVALILIALIVLTDLGRGTTMNAPASFRHGRAIDQAAFERALREGKMVEKEALFYKKSMER